MPIPPQSPPPDYEDQLRAAIAEAEEHARARPTEAARFYAIGLRVAADLYGMVEGVEPATRARRLADLERVGFVPAFGPDGAPNPAAAAGTYPPALPVHCGLPGPEHQHPTGFEVRLCRRSRRLM